MKPTDMNPLQTLLLIWAAGGVVNVEGDRLIVSGASLNNELREAIRHNKVALLKAMRPAGGEVSP